MNIFMFRKWLSTYYSNIVLTIRSLTYNHFMNSSYASDVIMEPMIWFVDNFTKFLGPVSSFDLKTCIMT